MSEPQDEIRPKDVSSGYGWFAYRPRILQSCLSPRWILFACCLLVGTEGFVVTGLTGVVITSIEKRYFLRSSQVGFIFASYEMGGTLLILVVSYYGHHHKSKWLGLGSLGFGLGCLVFASPQLMVGEYEPVVAQTSDLCQLNETLRNITDTSQLNCRSSDWYHLFVFIFGQVLIGSAGSPIYNLGAVYIDENVLRKNSGIYLGIFYAVSTLGPGIGYLLGEYFLTIYVDITLVRLACFVSAKV